MRVAWIVGAFALGLAGCAAGERPQAPPSRDAARVTGDDVARLFTEPFHPEVRVGFRVTRVRCARAGASPGQGGRWHFWRCDVTGSGERRSLDVMIQFADLEYGTVNVRDRVTGADIEVTSVERPTQAAPARIARLFTEPYVPRLNPGDGVLSAGCRPSTRDRSGVGSPWRCTLELDSEGRRVHTVGVDARGRFSTPYAGSGCCVRVRPPGDRAADGRTVPGPAR